MPKKRTGTEGVPDHELVIWTERSAAMVESGVSVMHAMDLLAQEETTPSLRAVTRDLMAKVEAGATLSQAMGDWPQVFGEQYVGLVISGEIGGILDIALRRVAERMEAGLLVPGWEESRPLTRADLAEWCWQFAQMLKAGVPPLYALRTLAKTTHPALRRVSEEAVEEVQSGGSLAPERDDIPADELPVLWRHPEIFTPTVRELIGFGVWFGPLDQHLLRAAGLLDAEARAEREGKLRPLTTVAAPPRPTSVEALKEEHPVVREVNDLFKAAIEKGAQWITLEPAEGGAGEATLTRGGDTLATITLPRYEQVVRRVKVIADIDPFAQDDRRSQIHLGYEGRKYFLSVHSRPAAGGGRLALQFGEKDGTVEL
jgi:hypothetical protein